MTTNSTDIDKFITRSRLRLRQQSPFFATLSLFARFISTQSIPTAATDGKDILFNPDFLLSLTPQERDGVILHEVLHAALLHVTRRGTREPLLWNIAADIVVNGLIVEQGIFQLPNGTIRKEEWEKMSVEEIYELLLKNSDGFTLDFQDLLPEAGNLGNPGDRESPSDKSEIESHWRNAMQQASVIARMQNQGKLPAGLERQLQELSEAQLDWRSYLWRYLVKTPNDFQDFDRRFISRGLYLETLSGESVQVFVAIDTSGSVGEKEMKLFLSEVKGILSSYPHIECHLYYADAAIYGPYSLKSDDDFPVPKGGGGTSFIPFFQEVEEEHSQTLEGVCVYLTDGYGQFPQSPPELPVLWVVTSGGLDVREFPFGEAIKLL